MDIQFNKIKPNHGIIYITLNEPDYKPFVDKKMKHYAKNVHFKGFRLGTVPMDLIKKVHGTSILVEELNKIAEASLRNYIAQEHIPVFMEPLLVFPSQEMDLENQRTFIFSYEVGLIEERSIVLGPDISVTKFEIDHVGYQLVDEFISGLQIVHGQAINLEESTVDSMLRGTLTDSTGAVGLDIRISVKHIPEHLRALLVGLRVGHKVTVTEEMLKHHFSALLGVSCSAFTSFKRYKAAWPAVFTISNIARISPAPIEPSLFNLVLGEGVAHSEIDFREAISKIILFDKRIEARYVFYENLRDELFKHNVVDLPEDFLKRWLISNNPEATLEEVESYYRAHEENLRWELLLGSIVRQNDLSVTKSDVIDEAQRAYVEYANNHDLKIEANDSAIHTNDFSFLRDSIGNKYYYKLHNQLSRDRAINFIEKRIVIVTETVTAEAFDARR